MGRSHEGGDGAVTPFHTFHSFSVIVTKSENGPQNKFAEIQVVCGLVFISPFGLQTITVKFVPNIAESASCAALMPYFPVPVMKTRC